MREFETLLLEDKQLGGEGFWRTLWLNRPEARNALSSEMMRDLRTALDETAKEPACRGLTLRGKGGMFCAGADLKGFRANAEGGLSLEEAAESSKEGGRVFAQVNEMPQVVVMLVEGAAIAGGLGLSCAGDVVLTAENARFSLTETRLGIIPAQIAPFVVQRFGVKTARRLMVTGAQFTGAESLALGYADYVLPDTKALEAKEMEIREAVRLCAPGANAAIKKLLRDMAAAEDREEILHLAGMGFAACLLGEEGREGIASFLEKRKPKWVGDA